MQSMSVLFVLNLANHPYTIKDAKKIKIISRIRVFRIFKKNKTLIIQLLTDYITFFYHLGCYKNQFRI